MFSPRLLALLDEVLAGRAPAAGRFCGYCYHPLAAERRLCPHCGRGAAEWGPAASIPAAVLEMHRRRRSREGLVVRSIAWGGLTLGVVLALLPLVFAGAGWWAILSFFAILAFFYVLSANLANSLGDALGYRWGQSVVRRRWERFAAERDSGPSPPS
ncbi:MAG TPA: hypothetical protein VFT91_11380 [Dehalococcoidia bacterium]|nr:hypothetical protein [Dehalococcoidia bacterium]